VAEASVRIASGSGCGNPVGSEASEISRSQIGGAVIAYETGICTHLRQTETSTVKPSFGGAFGRDEAG